MQKEDYDKIFHTSTPKYKIYELDKLNINQDEKEILYQLYPQDKNQFINIQIQNGAIISLTLRVYIPISLDPIGQLKNLQNLSILNMMKDSNSLCLKSLPNSFKKLRSLISLLLARTGLEEIPNWFQSLTSLRQFKCKVANLQTIPEWFSNLDQLIQLDLSKNQLINLPETFGKLKNLKCLELNNNKFTQLPDHFCDLINLEDLDLKLNNLQNLPPNFGNLNSLQYLQIDSNKLTQFPNDFGRLENLLQLAISYNPWQKNPGFKNSDLPKLQYVRLNSEFEHWFKEMRQRQHFHTHLEEFNYFTGTSSERIDN